MKLLIAGSRGLGTTKLIDNAIKYAGINIDEITEVIHGGAKGVDTAAGWWAENHNIPIRVFKAQWDKLDVPKAIIKTNGYGKYNARAGIDRNEIMAKEADVLLAIWDGESAGTLHMIETIKKLNKPYYVYEI